MPSFDDAARTRAEDDNATSEQAALVDTAAASPTRGNNDDVKLSLNVSRESLIVSSIAASIVAQLRTLNRFQQNVFRIIFCASLSLKPKPKLQTTSILQPHTRLLQDRFSSQNRDVFFSLSRVVAQIFWTF
jgi:hypothetical protein